MSGSRPDTPDACPPGWRPWLRKPLRRRVALPLSFLLAALAVGIPGRTTEIAWLRLVGIRAEAVIIGTPPPTPSTDRGGPDFWPLLSITRPDGTTIEAIASHPLRTVIIPPARGSTEWRRRTPQEGDRVAVRITGRNPPRITPERALACGLSPVMEGFVLLIIASLLCSLFRNHPPVSRRDSTAGTGLLDLLRRKSGPHDHAS